MLQTISALMSLSLSAIGSNPSAVCLPRCESTVRQVVNQVQHFPERPQLAFSSRDIFEDDCSIDQPSEEVLHQKVHGNQSPLDRRSAVDHSYFRSYLSAMEHGALQNKQGSESVLLSGGIKKIQNRYPERCFSREVPPLPCKLHPLFQLGCES